jgi:hypothetical protein
VWDRIEHRPASHGGARGRVCVFVCVFVCAGRVWCVCVQGGIRLGFRAEPTSLVRFQREHVADANEERAQAILRVYCALQCFGWSTVAVQMVNRCGMQWGGHVTQPANANANCVLRPFSPGVWTLPPVHRAGWHWALSPCRHDLGGEGGGKARARHQLESESSMSFVENAEPEADERRFHKEMILLTINNRKTRFVMTISRHRLESESSGGPATRRLGLQPSNPSRRRLESESSGGPATGGEPIG